MFAGKIELDELPEIWNEKYENYLHVKVPSDTAGVKQDLHWYSQYWGYFFGYALGDIMNAQIVSALGNQMPSWKNTLLQGHFAPIREWLAENVHKKGALFDSLQMIKEISGKDLSTRPFIDYITAKYSTLYNL